jgi:hypothetical protein
VRIYIAIENRYYPNAQDLIDGLTEVAPIIVILETNYRPSGAGMANELCRKFYNIRLADWKDVNEYTEQFKKINNDLRQLYISFTIPEPHLIQKFLYGLTPVYNVFQRTFTQTHTLVPVGGDAPVEAVTFSELVMETTNEKQRQKSTEDSPAVPHILIAQTG